MLAQSETGAALSVEQLEELLADKDRQLADRDRQLAAGRAREAQLVAENRSLVRRLSEMRVAFDAQQGALMGATQRALAYRGDVMEENLHLSRQLEASEHDRGVLIGTLLPLLADHGVPADPLDARDVANGARSLILRHTRGATPGLPPLPSVPVSLRNPRQP